jgi:hypothetical protein
MALDQRVQDAAMEAYSVHRSRIAQELADELQAVLLVGSNQLITVSNLTDLAVGSMARRSAVACEDVIAACRDHQVRATASLANDMLDAWDAVTIVDPQSVAAEVRHRSGRLQLNILERCIREHGQGRAEALIAFKKFAAELHAGSSPFYRSRIFWGRLAGSIAGLAAILTIILNAHDILGWFNLRPPFGYGTDVPIATTIAAAPVKSPIDGHQVLLEIVGIRNPGPSTVFRAFSVSARFNGMTVDGGLLNVIAPIILTSPAQQLAVVCMPDESLVKRALTPTPQGGALSGTLLVYFPGVDVARIDYSTLKTTFEDVAGNQYQAKPLDPALYHRMQIPADSCHFSTLLATPKASVR